MERITSEELRRIAAATVYLPNVWDALKQAADTIDELHKERVQLTQALEREGA